MFGLTSNLILQGRRNVQEKIMLQLSLYGCQDGGEEKNLDSILTEQLRLNKLCMKNSDIYRMLYMMRCMIEIIGDCTEKDCETITYRYCAKTFDYLFSETRLRMLYGEYCCLSVEKDIIANQSLYSDSKKIALSMCSIR
ncbi:hypothetical protein BDF14DRAFT_902889 [Spinellus fusiger]|nr:hypothetical protein BDF14DRAFT_902889 [Spinellus fusiger]